MNSFDEKIIKTCDNQTITARLFHPRHHQVKASVLIVPGMGAPQEYYRATAFWLATQGFLTATFDYRGTGLSRVGSLRGYKANIFDWAQKDCVAILDAVAYLSNDKPIYWLGHSLGGQIAGLVPNIAKVSKIITVAAGSGYWRENAPQLKRYVLLLWYFAVPLAISMYGYFPGKKWHIIGDLPKGAILQWRRWCLNPDYLIGAEGEHVKKAYETIQIPIVSLAIEDDEFISLEGVKSLQRFYQNAPKTILQLAPNNHGLKRIGHLGFFKPELQGLWDSYLLPALT